MFAGGGAWGGRFLVLDGTVIVAGGSIRRLSVGVVGVVGAVGAVAAVAVGEVDSSPAGLALAASSSHAGTPSAEENLHCYSTVPTTEPVEETRHSNTAAADPEV